VNEGVASKSSAWHGMRGIEKAASSAARNKRWQRMAKIAWQQTRVPGSKRHAWQRSSASAIQHL